MSLEPIVLAPRVTFLGPKIIPMLAFANNSLNPRLEVGADAVAIRVIKTRTLKYSELAPVTYKGWSGYQIGFSPLHGMLGYTAGFRTEVEARDTLALLAERGVSMDEAARRLLAS